MSTFGERFKQFREWTKLGQEDFAARCSLSQSNISQYERNLSKPSAEKIVYIMKQFPMLNIEWLVLGESQMIIDETSDSTGNEISKLKEENRKLRELLKGFL
jgi:transcriptional regulator with XRE-family HTH domain